MDKQIELLPCPFCGCTKIDIRRMPSQWQHPEYAAQCGECLTINGTTPSMEAAAEDWNQRTTPTPPAGQVEAVARAIRGQMKVRGFAPRQFCNLDTNKAYDEADIYAEAALQASGAEHIAGLVAALEESECQCDGGKCNRCHALKALPPELRGK